MILNIRGTSGSGKSTIVHNLLRDFEHENIYDHESFKKVKLVGYKMNGLIIVGSYATKCGGCDSITETNIGMKGMDYIEEFVREAATQGYHVLFEGLLITGIWGRFQNLGHEFPGQFIFGFMDTPYEECLRRVLVRNGGKQISEENLKGKFRAGELALEKAINFGERYVIINHTDPDTQVRQLFSEVGWQGIAKEVAVA